MVNILLFIMTLSKKP